MPCAKPGPCGRASYLPWTALCTVGLRLSTAFLDPIVQTVGKAGPNSVQFTGLPPFPFLGTQFSKTGTSAIPARCLVPDLLSTFPARTVTTTKKEWIFLSFFVVEVLGST